MKPRQRQAAILEYLQKQGKCSVEELAQYFDTTGTTIRKDLVILEHAGTVIRTYGGGNVTSGKAKCCASRITSSPLRVALDNTTAR